VGVTLTTNSNQLVGGWIYHILPAIAFAPLKDVVVCYLSYRLFAKYAYYGRCVNYSYTGVYYDLSGLNFHILLVENVCWTSTALCSPYGRVINRTWTYLSSSVTTGHNTKGCTVSQNGRPCVIHTDSLPIGSTVYMTLI